MEIHKNIKIENKYNISINDDYITYFEKGFQFVIDNYKETFDRIKNTKFENITPEFFFKEYIWVVNVSGFNSKVISKLFPSLLVAYESLFNFILSEGFYVSDIKENALKIFNNERKTDAIIKTAHILRKNIKEAGWETYKNNQLNSPDKLQNLPFVGDITKFHLARNLGLLEFVKPDRHLVRLADLWGFENSYELCSTIHKNYPSIPVGLIDLILFYTASTFGSK